MAPSATLPYLSQDTSSPDDYKSRNDGPLKKNGALDAAFKFEDLTPVIGREYPTTNIVDDLLNAHNSDEILRDVAITISQRGVVFFRKQDNLTNDLQKKFILRLGELTGRPTSSTLHIHPLLNGSNEFGVPDNEISTISSVARKKFFVPQKLKDNRKYDAAAWHSDWISGLAPDLQLDSGEPCG